MRTLTRWRHPANSYREALHSVLWDQAATGACPLQLPFHSTHSDMLSASSRSCLFSRSQKATVLSEVFVCVRDHICTDRLTADDRPNANTIQTTWLGQIGEQEEDLLVFLLKETEKEQPVVSEGQEVSAAEETSPWAQRHGPPQQRSHQIKTQTRRHPQQRSERANRECQHDSTASSCGLKNGNLRQLNEQKKGDR